MKASHTCDAVLPETVRKLCWLVISLGSHGKEIVLMKLPVKIEPLPDTLNFQDKGWLINL